MIVFEIIEYGRNISFNFNITRNNFNHYYEYNINIGTTCADILFISIAMLLKLSLNTM